MVGHNFFMLLPEDEIDQTVCLIMEVESLELNMEVGFGWCRGGAGGM